MRLLRKNISQTIATVTGRRSTYSRFKTLTDKRASTAERINPILPTIDEPKLRMQSLFTNRTRNLYSVSQTTFHLTLTTTSMHALRLLKRQSPATVLLRMTTTTEDDTWTIELLIRQGLHHLFLQRRRHSWFYFGFVVRKENDFSSVFLSYIGSLFTCVKS